MSEDAHAPPTRHAPELLYDASIPTPTHAERARTLVAQISTGTLCTLALEPEGYPYGSFVTVAFDNGNPIFLISPDEGRTGASRILERRGVEASGRDSRANLARMNKKELSERDMALVYKSDDASGIEGMSTENLLVLIAIRGARRLIAGECDDSDRRCVGARAGRTGGAGRTCGTSGARRSSFALGWRLALPARGQKQCA